MNDSFTDKRRIAVDEDRHVIGTVCVAVTILLRAATSECDRIDELEVAGVKAQGDVELFPCTRCPIAAVAHVVLDIPTATEHFGVGVVEGPENALGSLAHNIR